MAALSKAIRVTSVQLGPISIEAGIHGAVEDEDAGLVSLCVHADTEHKKEAPSRIKRTDYCPTCKNEERATYRKGKEIGGAVVLIDTTALQSLAAADEERKKKIELTVHSAADMGRAFPTGKSYFLSPRKGAENPYALLAALMTKRPDLAFVGEFSFGGPAALYQLVVADGVLAMRQLARPELVRDQPVVGGLVNEQWLVMAEQWADMMSASYDPAAYRDKRAEALAKLVEESMPVALASGGTAPGGGDLGAALAAALAAMAPPVPVEVPARRTRARKTAVPLAS